MNSLSASALAAAVAAAAAIPIAVLATRYPGRLTRLLERLAFAGNALPGIVIALSLVFFAANYASPLPDARTARLRLRRPVSASGAGGIESRSPPSAPASKKPPARSAAALVATTLTVTVPLIRSGILAGAALVFLSALKELPATLLLRPIGFETLATEIWKLTSVGAYFAAALPAPLLIAVSAPFVYVLSSAHEPTEVEHGRVRPGRTQRRRVPGDDLFLAFPIGEYRPDPNSLERDRLARRRDARRPCRPARC